MPYFKYGMDDTEYRKKLSEVAEWALPKLSATDTKESLKKKRGRGRPTDEQRYQDAHEEIFLDIYNGVNPTHPPELLKIKAKATVCDDCGCDCPEGRHKEKKLYETGGKRNWRERCLTCQKSKNPFNGKFELSVSEAPHIWTNYLRETKGLYKTAGNAARNNADLKESDK